MQVWSAGASFALAALSAASIARADPPGTTVVFGSPAPEIRVVEATIDPPPDGGDAQVATTGEPRSAPSSSPVAPRAEQTGAEGAVVDARVDASEAAAPERGRTSECARAITLVRRHGGRTERVRMPLLDCDGRPREEARRAISVLARARSIEEPPSEDEQRAWRERDGDPQLLAEGVRLLHPGLLERLQRIGEAFDPHPIEIVSGYRPEAPARSRHHHARALDIVVSGAPRAQLRDLAVTFPQTGVGWYPNSVFVHVDVREESAYWVDLSGPGERPRYVRGAEPPAPAETTPAETRPSDVVRIDEALDAVRRGVRVAVPSSPSGDASDDHSSAESVEAAAPTDEQLARMRRETEAVLRGIVVPTM